MVLRSEMSRWLSISVLAGSLLGCGQTGPLYLPPEPEAPPEAEIDTVVGAEAGLEAGIEAGREGELAEEGGGLPGDAVTSDAPVDSEVVIETLDESPAIEAVTPLQGEAETGVPVGPSGE